MKNTFAFLIMLFITPLAAAENAMQYGLINLDASATTDVSNDELITHLQVIEDGRDPAKLTSLVNKKTGLVLDALENFKAISAKTSNYNTRPLYHEGEISSWQVSQQLTLETSDFEQMSQFIAEINSLANIQSMQFRVSRQQAEQVKQALLKEAIGKFKNKAKLVADQFDSPKYQLVSLSVDGNHISPMPVMERATMMAADASGKGVPAALSAGSNEVTVQVRGTVQLQSE
jgi:predicted secreted protein